MQMKELKGIIEVDDTQLLIRKVEEIVPTYHRNHNDEVAATVSN